ncbi:hypothetical protein JX265_009871 [Neoarthrinium moseri]|uniref:Cytochrome P450 n=1 Tax=Neoarthrinium moseri TaxID=1658444 RepID=A0A9P9WFG5_9PEZI|nr:hypothetical protein JX265_009871 [Neoarthrinium moseri]
MPWIGLGTHSDRAVNYLTLVSCVLVIAIAILTYLKYQRIQEVRRETGQTPEVFGEFSPVDVRLRGYELNNKTSISGSTTAPLFRISLAGKEVTVVTPELDRGLGRIKNLGLHPLALIVFKTSLGLGKFVQRLLKEEDELSRQFHPEGTRLFHEEFIGGEKLACYVKKIDGYIRRDLSRIPDGGKVQIEDWIFRCLFGALGKSIWGEEGPFKEPAFLGHLRTLLLNLWALNNPIEFLVPRKLRESRQFVRDRLDGCGAEAYARRSSGQDTTDLTGSSLLNGVQNLCIKAGAPLDGWTDYQLSLIAGLGPNITAAAAWLIHHILSDTNRLSQIKAEIQNYISTSNGVVYVCEVKDKCPLLQATWDEVLRYHGDFTLGRYILKRGSYVLVPLAPYHHDPGTWGEDAKEFAPERFLKDGRIDESRKQGLRIYGVFDTRCPGRFLAAHMAMILTIRMLTEFDIKPKMEKYVVPEAVGDNLTGMAPPAHDIEVAMYRCDDRVNGLEIRYQRPKVKDDGGKARCQ